MDALFGVLNQLIAFRKGLGSIDEKLHGIAGAEFCIASLLEFFDKCCIPFALGLCSCNVKVQVMRKLNDDIPLRTTELLSHRNLRLPIVAVITENCMGVRQGAKAEENHQLHFE